MKSSAIFFNGVNVVEVQETTIPDPEPNEILIQTAYSCISPGTELRCLSGQQEGAPSWPFVPGYALSGHVIQVGSDVTEFAEGDRVFCRGTTRIEPQERLWGGHSGHAVVPADRVWRVPASLDLKEASLATLAAITLHGARMSRPQISENVLVFGLGPIGHLAARLHAVSGARVVGVDTMPERAAALQAAGISAICTPRESLEQAVREVLPEGADIVVDATGASQAVKVAMQFARDTPWGDAPPSGVRYLIQGSYPDEVALPYGMAFQKELTVLFTRDIRLDDIDAVFELCSRGKLSLAGILGEAFAPAEAPSVYAALQNRRPDLLTAAFRWS